MQNDRKSASSFLIVRIISFEKLDGPLPHIHDSSLYNRIGRKVHEGVA